MFLGAVEAAEMNSFEISKSHFSSFEYTITIQRCFKILIWATNHKKLPASINSLTFWFLNGKKTKLKNEDSSRANVGADLQVMEVTIET